MVWYGFVMFYTAVCCDALLCLVLCWLYMFEFVLICFIWFYNVLFGFICKSNSHSTYYTQLKCNLNEIEHAIKYNQIQSNTMQLICTTCNEMRCISIGLHKRKWIYGFYVALHANSWVLYVWEWSCISTLSRARKFQMQTGNTRANFHLNAYSKASQIINTSE